VAKAVDLLDAVASARDPKVFAVDAKVLMDFLKALNLEEIEVDVTSSQLLMSEELTIIRNSTTQNFGACPKASVLLNGDNERIRSIEAENTNLRGLLEQAKLELSKGTIRSASVTGDVEILKVENAQKASKIASLEKDIASLSGPVTTSVASNHLDAKVKELNEDIVAMKKEIERATIDSEKRLTAKTFEMTNLADTRVKEVETRLETEKEEMMEAMAQEVDEIEKSKDEEKAAILAEKETLLLNLAASANVTRAVTTNLSKIRTKFSNLVRDQRNLSTATSKDLSDMKQAMANLLGKD
jgi:hypothetical protein